MSWRCDRCGETFPTIYTSIHSDGQFCEKCLEKVDRERLLEIKRAGRQADRDRAKERRAEV